MRNIELRTAVLSEFDIDNPICEIPAERMKIRSPYFMQLSTQALDLLNELKMMTANYHYAFSGRSDSNDPSKPMNGENINQLIKRISYGGKLTGHSFRCVMSTLLHKKGFYLSWVDIQLARVDKIISVGL